MNKFDQIVLGALDIGQAEALKRKNSSLEALHLFYGLLSNKGSFTHKAFKNEIKIIENKLSQLPTSSSEVSIDQLKPSHNLNQWLTMASADVAKDGKSEVTEKYLLKYLPQIFPDLDLDYNKLGSLESDEESEVPAFFINLNELAEEGKLDPVIGRTKEIRAVMEILGRRGKNNPVLVGPAGVGKTAIVEGLAGEIVKNKVPDVLKGKTIYSVDLGALMAGTKFRGEFEERIQAMLKFVKNNTHNIILFIDEIHQLVGAGKTEGAMDAANLLKPALARGELHCIGATTFDEYQKYILKDAALDRRFRSVPVFEPSKEDSIEILMGIKEKHEMHHGIKISDEAIYSSVMLSDQYITDKNLPDKAIDLIDEAASALKLSAEAMPSKLVELESEIRNKKILALVEKGNNEIQAEIEKLQGEFDVEKAKWEKEVLALKKMSEIRNRLDRLKFDLEVAERNQDYENASRIKYQLIPEVEKELENHSHEWVLNEKHIGNVISRQTGIPVEKILKTKQEELLQLENILNQRVFGQEKALHEIAETLLASYAGLSDPTKPMGSFLLLGPTGVGKTETAKALTEYLFHNEQNILRFDLSEFSEKHSVSKLIGSPAGYVGYDDGGVLTEAVRRKPYSVILFDEIEKAHSDFSDILLQILDDGRLTDNKGRVINFKNTIILLTSNSKNIELDFKPEVLGRLDAILTYNPLDQSVMGRLVDKQINLLNERLKSKKLKIEFTEKAKNHLAEIGYDEKYGARPLQNSFNRLVVRPLSKKILGADLSEDKVLKCDLTNDEISIN